MSTREVIKVRLPFNPFASMYSLIHLPNSKSPTLPHAGKTLIMVTSSHSKPDSSILRNSFTTPSQRSFFAYPANIEFHVITSFCDISSNTSRATSNSPQLAYI
ncbi:hypothetical protein TorRG33x02_074430 [Trema orientale]|uniref:Uncharacterized protein n=1 Tax=Trema orientale TaxID=63057 RepID=A0A2P5FG16_TREOI|nr:hypothetical protein TorRG33x02_074430 [Trema orientale]